MNKSYTLYVALGRQLFWLLLPIERFFIRRTHRVYALHVKDNKVLLVRNWLGDGKWALPGGGIAKHETSVQALKRELNEELSVEISTEDLKFIKDGIWHNHKLGFKYELFALKADINNFKTRKWEITKVGWVNIQDLNPANTPSDILGVLKTIY